MHGFPWHTLGSAVILSIHSVMPVAPRMIALAPSSLPDSARVKSTVAEDVPQTIAGVHLILSSHRLARLEGEAVTHRPPSWFETARAYPEGERSEHIKCARLLTMRADYDRGDS
jgi:hypothetical protein